MTKAKIVWVIKRISYIDDMLRENITEKEVRISKQKEKIVIDDNVVIILEIIDEIMKNEKEDWIREIFKLIRKGASENCVLSSCPIGRTKYYNLKSDFINKIYQCCIHKQLVNYDTILTQE